MNPETTGLAHRLRILVEQAKNVTAFAAFCDIPQSTMHSWVTGSREPRVSDIVKISTRAGVRLEWLAAGEGPMRIDETEEVGSSSQTTTTDHRLIGRLTEKIMLIYKEMGVTLALHQAAERAAQEHDRIVAEVADPDDRLIQIGVVMTALREELRAKAASPSSSKRRA